MENFAQKQAHVIVRALRAKRILVMLDNLSKFMRPDVIILAAPFYYFSNLANVLADYESAKFGC